jgi:hypothetical protein
MSVLVRFGLLHGHQFFQHSMQMRCPQLDITRWWQVMPNQRTVGGACSKYK